MPSLSTLSTSTAAAALQVHGIDVSAANGNLSFPLLAQAKTGVLIGKACEGITFKDKKFDANRSGAHANDIPFAMYHFVRPGDSVAGQMNNIRKVVGPFQLGDLQWVALDLEKPDNDPDAWNVIAQKDRTAYVDEFVDAFLAEYGVLPLLYMNQSFFPEVLGGIAGNMGRCKLWLAAPGAKTLDVPGPWKLQGPTLVQTSFEGKWPGVHSANVDLDTFNGSEDELRAFMLSATV